MDFSNTGIDKSRFQKKMLMITGLLKSAFKMPFYVNNAIKDFMLTWQLKGVRSLTCILNTLLMEGAFFKGSNTSKTRKYLMCVHRLASFHSGWRGIHLVDPRLVHYPKVEAVHHTLCRRAENNYLKGKGTRGFSPDPRLI